jgi:hypothetical protein
MTKRLLHFTICSFFCVSALAQKQKPAQDSLAYYDDLFNELDSFLDSMTAPRSVFIVSIGAGNNFFNYQSQSNQSIAPKKKIAYSPSIGFFHKNGLGINSSASIIKDGGAFNAYQFSVTGSYDYLKSNAFITGVNLTRFITKDSLSFYTSPLKNEAGIYFLYKGWPIKPSVTLTYGWGSRSDYEETAEYLIPIRSRRNGYTRVNTTESINDLSLAASVRRDFYWLNKLGNNSVLRLTPQLSFTSGTQKFGFNQTNDSYITVTKGNNGNGKGKGSGKGANTLFNSENVELEDVSNFKPLSLTAFLKTSVSFGKFSLQPQVGLDYYFPAKENNFTTLFTVNAALAFD